MLEKERNEIFNKIVTGLHQSNEAMLRAKKARGEKVCYSSPDGKPYTITARTALKKFLSQS